jgi:hypothetical protein
MRYRRDRTGLFIDVDCGREMRGKKPGCTFADPGINPQNIAEEGT